jgi:putative Mg2+ transporter-C (MgtC) family protein
MQGNLEILDIVLRIVLSILFSGLVGLEREKTKKPAGLRTHVLVSLGATVVMLTGIALAGDYQDISPTDPSRMGAQVISGIGFLGAGTILRSGFDVRGLTTAATIWAVGCIGLAIGAGYYEIALSASAAVFIILRAFSHINLKKYDMAKIYSIEMEFNLDFDPDKLYKDIDNDEFKILDFQLREKHVKLTVLKHPQDKEFSIFNYLSKEDVAFINIKSETGV